MAFARTRLSSACLILGAMLSSTSSSAASSPLHQEAALQKPSAGMNRPQNVPENYIITPFGYVHPSCMQSLAKGEKLLPDGRLQHADGTTVSKAATCNFPRFSAQGSLLNPRSTAIPGASGSISKAPAVNGWVESAYVTTAPTSAYGAIIARWTVPPSPAVDDGQVIYFFPGFEDYYDVESILQPVLGWYQGQWTVASWNCCLNGIVTNSPPVQVAPGDRIYGSITSNCPVGTLTCASWNVLSLDLSTGQSTELSNTPSDGQQFTWAFGGVLEAYSIVQCKDYPKNHELHFDKLTLFDQYLQPVQYPSWTQYLDYSATPQCSYGVNALTNEIAVSY